MVYKTLIAGLALTDSEKEIILQTDRYILAEAPFIYANLQDAYGAGWEECLVRISDLADQTRIPKELITLCFFLRFSVEHAYPICQRQGIPDAVFYATMGHGVKYVEMTRLKTGHFGILPERYIQAVCSLLELNAFRIETLMFERIRIEKDLEVDGAQIKKGEHCISVHIPRGSDLSQQTCEATFAAAKAFFQQYFGYEKVFCHCWSWLLHPWIPESLGENTNLVKFQKKFKLYEVEDCKTAPLEYVFPQHWKPEDKSFDHYPENTSLQRILKKRLIEDLPVGVAKGIRLL